MNPLVRSRGFRVEHFIRPPVQLDFEFQLPLNIACIIVQPELAPSSEMRLELAGSVHTSSISSNLVTLCPSATVRGNQTLLLFENKSFKKRDGRTVSISNKDTLISCAVVGSYMNQVSCLVGVQLMMQPLKHPNILAKMRQLRVTVSRMSGPKPVALKRLEVWGVPSHSCSSHELVWLQKSLAAAQTCAGSLEGVKLYCSQKSGPEHGSVADQQDTITANDLHRPDVDTGLGCSDACNWKTWCSGGGEYLSLIHI